MQERAAWRVEGTDTSSEFQYSSLVFASLRSCRLKLGWKERTLAPIPDLSVTEPLAPWPPSFQEVRLATRFLGSVAFVLELLSCR